MQMIMSGYARISIHALLAESDNNINSSVNTADKISIHALLAESDDAEKVEKALHNAISIHALLAESDYPKKVNLYNDSNFYPRSPCGERHLTLIYFGFMPYDFYPRSPCGERRCQA